MRCWLANRYDTAHPAGQAFIGNTGTVHEAVSLTKNTFRASAPSQGPTRPKVLDCCSYAPAPAKLVKCSSCKRTIKTSYAGLPPTCRSCRRAARSTPAAAEDDAASVVSSVSTASTMSSALNSSNASSSSSLSVGASSVASTRSTTQTFDLVVRNIDTSSVNELALVSRSGTRPHSSTLLFIFVTLLLSPSSSQGTMFGRFGTVMDVRIVTSKPKRGSSEKARLSTARKGKRNANLLYFPISWSTENTDSGLRTDVGSFVSRSLKRRAICQMKALGELLQRNRPPLYPATRNRSPHTSTISFFSNAELHSYPCRTPAEQPIYTGPMVQGPLLVSVDITGETLLLLFFLRSRACHKRRAKFQPTGGTSPNATVGS
mmetsp:Transcript_48568/g.136481  ORF Transcript_48568/g.136481 Transcript_48568/m.136481 type:complete len:374 (+) Transcript_48568:188-1309(+)